MTVGATNSTTNAQNTNDLNSGQNQLNTTYSSFLTLLTAQLKNQDPLSPMDTNTFTQQLVEMNGVQQQLLTNNLLQQLVTNSTGAGSIGSAVSLMGKQVTSQSSTADLQDGAANWTYNLAANAAKASMEVLDAKGNVVWSGDAPSAASGDHAFTWNGKETDGATAPDGAYTLQISATDSTGADVASTVSVSGMVTGVQVSNGSTQVDIGDLPVDLGTITSVKNPSTTTSS